MSSGLVSWVAYISMLQHDALIALRFTHSVRSVTLCSRLQKHDCLHASYYRRCRGRCTGRRSRDCYAYLQVADVSINTNSERPISVIIRNRPAAFPSFCSITHRNTSDTSPSSLLEVCTSTSRDTFNLHLAHIARHDAVQSSHLTFGTLNVWKLNNKADIVKQL